MSVSVSVRLFACFVFLRANAVPVLSVPVVLFALLVGCCCVACCCAVWCLLLFSCIVVHACWLNMRQLETHTADDRAVPRSLSGAQFMLRVERMVAIDVIASTGFGHVPAKWAAATCIWSCFAGGATKVSSM